ncbi:hypothetical protein NC653_004916 [Populus alba x Populus x berolinensis]|uniref:Uncharacterized protein n=1 Tax=Populus alba x Populus x berolinensis TaxID=444605 RepID=A0AAD6RAS3_9ROSI|nr:hypothetical protein NC653_004916 [Populus alba x Populus x berolinensis]
MISELWRICWIVLRLSTGLEDSQFDVVKAGKAANSGSFISVNPVFLKAGIPSPTALLKISPLYQTTDRICYGTDYAFIHGR